MNTPKNQHNLFLKFRKTTRISKYDKKFLVDEKEIPDKTHVIKHIIKFYEHFLKEQDQTAALKTKKIYSQFDIREFSETKTKLLEEYLSKKCL